MGQTEKKDFNKSKIGLKPITFEGHKFIKFPDRKPADNKKVKFLTVDNRVLIGCRYRDEQLKSRVWNVWESNEDDILQDTQIKGWWYID